MSSSFSNFLLAVAFSVEVFSSEFSQKLYASLLFPSSHFFLSTLVWPVLKLSCFSFSSPEVGNSHSGCPPAPDLREAHHSSIKPALKDKTRPQQLPGFVDTPFWAGSSPSPDFAAQSHSRWNLPALQCRRCCAGIGRWPAFLSAPLPPRCMVLLRLTLNASHTVRAMAAMTAGTSHYHYLWFLNTACYKNCLKHRGRRLHYCIIAHVLKPDFLLHFQPGQFSLKNWVSNLLGFNIGIFSPLCPFLVILYNNISDFTSFSMECIIQTSLPRPLAFHYQSPSTATKVPVSCTTLFSHSAAS